MQANSLHDYLDALHHAHANNQNGAVASYIPELTKADPTWFGIALITVDGHVYQVGDSRQTFTIQSISKAITYGLALEDRDVDAVLAKVGVEPSGEAFNSISLEPETGRPMNPMINAGAIATVSLIDGASSEEKLARMLKCYERYLGHPIEIDQEVYQSEKSTGHRNRAIAYLLRNSNIIEKDTDEVLDLYFKQCSMLVTCRDLALIGATLANNGVNPITGVRALQSRHVSRVLSVMSSCGMYDYSGSWVYEVGMPAKSGVGGGIVAVLPGQFGLAVFSPKLDEKGNSVRGIAVCRQISSDFALHLFDTGRPTVASVIHHVFNARQIASNRVRRQDQRHRLSDLGDKICVVELQGDLVFASGEIVVHECIEAAKNAEYLILDFARVGVINEGATKLLCTLIETFHAMDKTILLTGIHDKYILARTFKKLPGVESKPVLDFDDVDYALEWCENQVLGISNEHEEGPLPLSEQAICAGLSEAELAWLETFIERKSFAPGEYLCHEGESADSVFFIISGQVSVNVPIANRRKGRISKFSAGSAIGEMSVMDKGKRSADLVAETAVECAVLFYEKLESVTDAVGSAIRIKLLTNIARVLVQRLRQTTMEVKLLRS